MRTILLVFLFLVIVLLFFGCVREGSTHNRDFVAFEVTLVYEDSTQKVLYTRGFDRTDTMLKIYLLGTPKNIDGLYWDPQSYRVYLLHDVEFIQVKRLFEEDFEKLKPKLYEAERDPDAHTIGFIYGTRKKVRSPYFSMT